MVENFPKNKKFQNKISYLFLLLSCPCGVKFSSPRAVSKPVFGASNKKIVLSTPKIVLFDQTGRFHELQGGESTILGVESTILWLEPPQTGFETARGLENLTPRGHDNNTNTY